MHSTGLTIIVNIYRFPFNFGQLRPIWKENQALLGKEEASICAGFSWPDTYLELGGGQ
jgi:hypothetical protein